LEEGHTIRGLKKEGDSKETACLLFISIIEKLLGAHGGAFGSGTALQAGRSRVRFPMAFIGIFH